VDAFRRIVIGSARLLGYVPTDRNVASQLRVLSGHFTASTGERLWRYFIFSLSLTVVVGLAKASADAMSRPWDRPEVMIFAALGVALLAGSGYVMYRAHVTVVLEHGRISAIAWSRKVIWSEPLDSLERVLITQGRGNYFMQLRWPYVSHRVELWDSLLKKLAGP
jgi:hypothetical protein